MTEFTLASAIVRPSLNEIERDGKVERVQAKVMEVLIALCDRHHQVVTQPELLQLVWGRKDVASEGLQNAIWALRKVLGDDVRSPKFIQTIPRRGYRLLVTPIPISPRVPERSADTTMVTRPATGSDPSSRFRLYRRLGWGLIAVIVALAFFLLRHQRSLL